MSRASAVQTAMSAKNLDRFSQYRASIGGGVPGGKTPVMQASSKAGGLMSVASKESGGGAYSRYKTDRAGKRTVAEIDARSAA